ncbi:MAG: STM3941 family protein [Bacteroidia bacterium]
MQTTIRFASSKTTYLYLILLMLVLGGLLAGLYYYYLSSPEYRVRPVFTALVWIGIITAVFGIVISIYRLFMSHNIYLEISSNGIRNKLIMRHTIDIPWTAIKGFELKSDRGIQKVITVYLHNEYLFLGEYRRISGKSIPMANMNRKSYSSPVIISTLMLEEKSLVLLEKLNEYLRMYGQRR